MQTAKGRLAAQAREEARILRRSLPLVILVAALIWLGTRHHETAPNRREPVTVTQQEHFG